MAVAHAAEDGFSRLRVAADLHGGVFLDDAMDCRTHLVHIRLGARADGGGVERVRIDNAIEDEWLTLSAECVASCRVLQLVDGNNVARDYFLSILLLLAAHEVQLTDALGFALLFALVTVLGPSASCQSRRERS